jgi:type VI secretion system protein
MRCGLFSRIGSRRPSLHPATDDEAIIDHLDVLLNATRGQSASAPQFGLPDFVDLAYSPTDTIERAIERGITEFEPRLEGVVVRRILESDVLDLRFEITARRRHSQRKLNLQTRLTAGGRFEVG